jgi:hypothetical protein
MTVRSSTLSGTVSVSNSDCLGYRAPRLSRQGQIKSSVFKAKNVHVKVDTLKFSIRDSKHDFLYSTLRPLATGLVKKQIQKAFGGAITAGLEYVDGQLVTVRDRVEDAKETEGVSRIEVLQNVGLMLHRRPMLLKRFICSFSSASSLNLSLPNRASAAPISRSLPVNATPCWLRLGIRPDG